MVNAVDGFQYNHNLADREMELRKGLGYLNLNLPCLHAEAPQLHHIIHAAENVIDAIGIPAHAVTGAKIQPAAQLNPLLSSLFLQMKILMRHACVADKELSWLTIPDR